MSIVSNANAQIESVQEDSSVGNPFAEMAKSAPNPALKRSVSAKNSRMLSMSQKVTYNEKQSFGEQLLKWDMFGQPFDFRIKDRDIQQFKSVYGCFFTFLLAVAILINLSLGVIEIHTFQNENVVSWTDTRSFEGERLGNLHFAAALASFQKDYATDLLTPDIGTLNAYMKRWGTERQNKTLPMLEKLPLKPCEYSGSLLKEYIDSGEQFDLSPDHKRLIKTYGGMMQCMDEDVNLVGDFKAFSGSSFMYAFERCDPAGPIECKSDEEISAFLENKYLIIMSNQTSFNYTGHMGN